MHGAVLNTDLLIMVLLNSLCWHYLDFWMHTNLRHNTNVCETKCVHNMSCQQKEYIYLFDFMFCVTVSPISLKTAKLSNFVGKQNGAI